jgi:hypothetical protein
MRRDSLQRLGWQHTTAAHFWVAGTGSCSSLELLVDGLRAVRGWCSHWFGRTVSRRWDERLLRTGGRADGLGSDVWDGLADASERDVGHDPGQTTNHCCLHSSLAAHYRGERIAL